MLLFALIVSIQIPLQGMTKEPEEKLVFGGNPSTESSKEIPDGGEIRIATTWAPGDMNPYIDFKAFSIHGATPIYSALFRADENGTLRSDLADNCTTSDGIEFVINLVQNATWHDTEEFIDEPFTYEDALYTLEVLMNGTYLDPWWGEHYDWNMIESVNRGENDYQLIIHLNKTYIEQFLPRGIYPNFPYLFLDRLPIIPEHIHSKEGLKRNGTIIGTGPYMLSSLNFDKEGEKIKNMTLDVYTKYFGGRSHLDKLHYRYDISEDKFDDEILSNNIDLAGCAFEFIDPNQVSEISKVPAVSSESTIDTIFESLFMNMNHSALANHTIRIAITKSINKQAICDGPYGGYAVPAVGYICPGLKDWFNPNVTQYSFDPVEAGKILASENLNLTLKVRKEDERRLNETEIIANNLRDVGINVTVIQRPYEDFINDLKTGNFSLAVGGFATAIDPDAITYSFWHSNATPPIGWNVWGFKNSTIDSMIKQAIASLNMTEKQKIHKDIQKEIAYLAPNVFLCWKKLTTIQNNDFHGIIRSAAINPIDSISIERTYYKSTLSAQGKSPMRYCFIDPEGRITGYYNGTIYEDIPNSVYRPEENLVLLMDPQVTLETTRIVTGPNGTTEELLNIEYFPYRVVLNGTGTGNYSLELVNLGLGCRSQNIPKGEISEGETVEYWLYLYKTRVICQSYPPPLMVSYGPRGFWAVVPYPGVDPRVYQSKKYRPIVPL